MQITKKLTVLVNNTVYLPGLQAEHGWSVLIETKNESVLFDLGQSNLFKKNAAVLGCDLEKVNKVVLSHGHYDHTGGLNSFLSLNPDAIVFAHPNVFKKRYSVKEGNLIRDISMPAIAENHRNKFCFTLEPTQVFFDVFVTGEIARQFDTQEITKGLFLDPEGKDVDFVLDDQSLIINTSRGIVVLLGCCHAGIANTLGTVADFTGENKFYMVLGGMHLSNASEDMMWETVQGLHKFHVQKIGLAHCTGHRGTEALTRLFSGEIFSCDVGTVIQLK